MSARRYTAIPTEYTQPVNIKADDGCNGFTIVNRGNTLVRINSEPLLPGEAKAVGGNEDEIYVGSIRIQFDSTGVTPPLINSAWVTQKIYLYGEQYDTFGK
jgi:hypothetical protein